MITQADKNLIWDLKNEGATHRDISEIVFGKRTSASSVHNVLAEMGHPEVTKTMTTSVYPEQLGTDSFTKYKHVTGQPKTLIFDIETSPLLVYTWGLFKQNIGINQIKDDWYVLCWGAKWVGSDEVISAELESFESRLHSEFTVVYKLWELLNEADIVVAHNAVAFDVKKMNAKFLEWELPQPTPFRIVDTLNIVKQQFRLTSNKLDYVARFLEQGGKIKTDFSLWQGCMDDNKQSWVDMVKYCKQDVTELEDVYHSIKGWDKKHPNVALYSDKEDEMCTVCGGTDLKPVGHATTNISKFEALRCGGCGHVVRRRTTTLTKEKRKSIVTNIG